MNDGSPHSDQVGAGRGAAMQCCPERAVDAAARDVAPNQAGYGTDPDLVKNYTSRRPVAAHADGGRSARTAAALCDLIIPADDMSPAASTVGVVDFIDEWISAPYPQQRGDRALVLAGLTWIDAEAQKRFGKAFPALSDAQRAAIATTSATARARRPSTQGTRRSSSRGSAI